MANNFANSFGNFDVTDIATIPDTATNFVHFVNYMINFVSIMFTGVYDPVNFPDGGLMEDSSFYDLAFEAGTCLGTIPGECLLMVSL